MMSLTEVQEQFGEELCSDVTRALPRTRFHSKLDQPPHPRPHQNLTAGVPWPQAAYFMREDVHDAVSQIRQGVTVQDLVKNLDAKSGDIEEVRLPGQTTLSTRLKF